MNINIFPEMRADETAYERMVRAEKKAHAYIRSTHKADGNDIRRIESKLDKILTILARDNQKGSD